MSLVVTLCQQGPAPLFPKHRRGLYVNGQGLEVLDATPQSPPLDTDDPGVPEPGVYEINMTTRMDRSPDSRRADLVAIDANYGLLPTILGHPLPAQLKVEVPVSAAGARGQPLAAGIGTASVGLKCNFYNSERHAVAIAWYPQLEFAVGSRAVDRGIADRGQTIVMPLLVSKDFTYVTVVVNAAVNAPLHDPDRHVSGTLGAGLGLALTRKVAAMVELHGDARAGPAAPGVITLRAGLMRAIGHAAVFYLDVGRTIASGDQMAHTYAGAGVKILIKPGVKTPH